MYSEKDNDKKIEQFRKFVPKDMDVIKRAYDLIRKRERLNEEKRSYETVVNARK